MFTRILGYNAIHRNCQGGSSCPDILELDGGDFAIIGVDITDEARGSLPAGAGCGPQERIIRIPRRILVQARNDIPVLL